MAQISRDQVKEMMAEVMRRQNKVLPESEETPLDEIGFRSLDFSELALRVEDELDEELNFDAPGLRSIRTVGDVLDFIDELQKDL
ncbi:acyl carrier protein [Tessaracoccus oleiagri]|uniref:Acyl carrier protein n=1 Tax=Tessaracoccus oleiagri TaxID=686624 RepID=A0A1G9HF78_9ACTN|nr:acyl carrier protein [Tessaracoccus oleiagri]SDL11354.1 acyl carrier protein [Tessaracoccus oleiagri]